MKKFIAVLVCIAVVAISADILYYRIGVYVDLHPDKKVETFVKTQGDKVLMNKGNGYEEFEIKGVNMGSGIPGKWSTDFAIDEDTYLRWFGYIKEMGANTIRVYTIQNSKFYDAFYKYNENNPDPLYMIHGVWVNDYVQNSHRDAYDKDFFDTFQKDCLSMIDVIHGKKKIHPGEINSAGSGKYLKDVSPWVIGYILGVEWEDITVAYTDDKYGDNEKYKGYHGKYLETTDDATVFETLLAKVGDSVMKYESKRYKVQKLLAFSNWPTTDPFTYSEEIEDLYMKCACVDTEHIKTTKDVISGQFASYHVYPYYPDYLTWTDDWKSYGVSKKDYMEKGETNTYRAYLCMLTKHHSMPVVISEFGVSTGRGMAHQDLNTNRNQGHMSEQDQGDALRECYEDIKSSGCAGSCIFSWQDEWFKRTWNTMYAVDMTRNPYWSDYQTNEQYFGLLSFDPGDKKSVCYVDGDVSEWKDKDIVADTGDLQLSTKYDERFVYFLIEKKNLNFKKDTIYVPMDITPKSGSSYCSNFNLKFDRGADFVMKINGRDNSRVMVQERYEVLRSTYSQNLDGFDTYLKDNLPAKDAPGFTNIDMILEIINPDKKMHPKKALDDFDASFETGKLRYGNANPEAENFDSLADFICNGDYVEVKIPWQILNFADPSTMEIHDDYYDGNYGIKYININKMYLGITEGGKERCKLEPMELKGWDRKVTYHERLKKSYYTMQKVWGGKSAG